MSTTTEQVAAEVRTLMDARGVTQVELSTATGIPRQTLQRRLAGHGPFDIGELHAIAAYLGVKASTLMETVA